MENRIIEAAKAVVVCFMVAGALVVGCGDDKGRVAHSLLWGLKGCPPRSGGAVGSCVAAIYDRGPPKADGNPRGGQVRLPPTE